MSAPLHYGPTGAPASLVAKAFEDRRREYERNALTYPEPDRSRNWYKPPTPRTVYTAGPTVEVTHLTPEQDRARFQSEEVTA